MSLNRIMLLKNKKYKRKFLKKKKIYSQQANNLIKNK